MGLPHFFIERRDVLWWLSILTAHVLNEGDWNLFRSNTWTAEASRSLTALRSRIQGRRLPRVHWRTVSSFRFLCSCSKSGGGSRGGQAVKLAGRNPDMKRRCGIACRHKPRHDLKKTANSFLNLPFSCPSSSCEKKKIPIRASIHPRESSTRIGERESTTIRRPKSRRSSWREAALRGRRKRPEVKVYPRAAVQIYAQKTCRRMPPSLGERAPLWLQAIRRQLGVARCCFWTARKADFGTGSCDIRTVSTIVRFCVKVYNMSLISHF